MAVASLALLFGFAGGSNLVFGLLQPKKERRIDYSQAVPLQVSFEVRKPKKLRAKADLSCAEARDEQNAFAAYEAVRKMLSDGIDPETIPYLDCFLPDRLSSDDPQKILSQFLGEVFEPNALYGYLQRKSEEHLHKVVQQGDLRHGSMAWGTGMLGNIALVAYQRTGQTRFVDLYVDFFERVMEMRDSVLGLHDDYHDRVMDAWGSANLGRNAGDASLWVAHVTHFSIIMRPATGFARLINEDPALAEYRPFAEDVIDFFSTAYRQFDVDLRPAEGADEVWFWRPLVNKFEATNHVHLQGQTLLNMYAITGDEFYADRIRWIIRVFERGVEIDKDGYIAWNYFPYLQVPESMNDPNARGYSEYVWKAGLTVPFLYEAVQAGFEVDPSIIAATTKTIREHVVANNDLAHYFHPRNQGSIPEDAGRASIIGFLSAATDDPAIEAQIIDIITTRRDLYPEGWLNSGRMALGYATQLNRDRSER